MYASLLSTRDAISFSKLIHWNRRLCCLMLVKTELSGNNLNQQSEKLMIYRYWRFMFGIFRKKRLKRSRWKEILTSAHNWKSQLRTRKWKTSFPCTKEPKVFYLCREKHSKISNSIAECVMSFFRPFIDMSWFARFVCSNWCLVTPSFAQRSFIPSGWSSSHIQLSFTGSGPSFGNTISNHNFR